MARIKSLSIERKISEGLLKLITTDLIARVAHSEQALMSHSRERQMVMIDRLCRDFSTFIATDTGWRGHLAVPRDMPIVSSTKRGR
jgi:hypothetical protein